MILCAKKPFLIPHNVWKGLCLPLTISVINSFVLTLSYFFYTVKVKINAFQKLHAPDGGNVGCGIWKRLELQNRNCSSHYEEE